MDHDLIIGSRYVEGGGFENCSAKRIFRQSICKRLPRWVIGWKVRDCSSAYRLYRVQPWCPFLGPRYAERVMVFGRNTLHLIDRGNRWTQRSALSTPSGKRRSKISIREVLSTIQSLHRVAHYVGMSIKQLTQRRLGIPARRCCVGWAFFARRTVRSPCSPEMAKLRRRCARPEMAELRWIQPHARDGG